jgi:hypothetical protein
MSKKPDPSPVTAESIQAALEASNAERKATGLNLPPQLPISREQKEQGQ